MGSASDSGEQSTALAASTESERPGVTGLIAPEPDTPLLALQHRAGNRAVARALSAAAANGDAAPAGAAGARRTLVLARQKQKAKAPAGSGGTWVVPPKSNDPQELASALIDEFNDSVSQADYESGVWAVMVITGGRLHVFDSDGKSFGIYQLKSNARLPGDGYYISGYVKTDKASGWTTKRLFSSPAGDAWVGWSFSGKDAKSTVMLEDWVSSTDRTALEQVLGSAVTRIAVCVSGVGSASSGEQARAQANRIRAQIAKEVDRRKSPKDGPPADPKAPKLDAPAKPAGASGASMTPKAPGAPSDAPITKDLPDTVVVVEDRSGVHIRITVEGARQDLDYRDGGANASLMKRIQDATLKVRDEIDPSKSVRVAGSGEKATVAQKPGGGGVQAARRLPGDARRARAQRSRVPGQAEQPRTGRQQPAAAGPGRHGDGRHDRLHDDARLRVDELRHLGRGVQPPAADRLQVGAARHHERQVRRPRGQGQRAGREDRFRNRS